MPYAYASGPSNNPYLIGQGCFLRDSYPPFNQRQVTDIHESMPYVARASFQANRGRSRTVRMSFLTLSISKNMVLVKLRVTTAGSLIDAFSRSAISKGRFLTS